MHCRTLRLLAILGPLALAVPADPALARRTVIDASSTVITGQYCSPISAFTPECLANPMGFSIQVGASSYNSFYVNSNGTVSFGSIESSLAPQNSFDVSQNPGPGNYTGPAPADSLGDFSVPIFSPYFLDGPGDPTSFVPNLGFDGELVAEAFVSASAFTASWYSCTNPLTCGLETIQLIENATPANSDFGMTQLIMSHHTLTCPCDFEEAFESGKQNLLAQLEASMFIYTMTLTDLADGFRVDFSYSPAALGTIGEYGFNLPTGLVEVTGPLANRTFFFDSTGQLITSVPEPRTWMMMLFGLGVAGFALRRQRDRRPLSNRAHEANSLRQAF